MTKPNDSLTLPDTPTRATLLELHEILLVSEGIQAGSRIVSISDTGYNTISCVRCPAGHSNCILCVKLPLPKMFNTYAVLNQTVSKAYFEAAKAALSSNLYSIH